jgi:hypothetical protein
MPGFSYLQIFCSDLVMVVGFIVIRFAVRKRLLMFLSALFWKRLSSFACRFLQVNLLFFAERRLPFVKFLVFF